MSAPKNSSGIEWEFLEENDVFDKEGHVKRNSREKLITPEEGLAYLYSVRSYITEHPEKIPDEKKRQALMDSCDFLIGLYPPLPEGQTPPPPSYDSLRRLTIDQRSFEVKQTKISKISFSPPKGTDPAILDLVFRDFLRACPIDYWNETIAEALDNPNDTDAQHAKRRKQLQDDLQAGDVEAWHRHHLENRYAENTEDGKKAREEFAKDHPGQPFDAALYEQEDDQKRNARQEAWRQERWAKNPHLQYQDLLEDFEKAEQEKQYFLRQFERDPLKLGGDILARDEAKSAKALQDFQAYRATLSPEQEKEYIDKLVPPESFYTPEELEAHKKKEELESKYGENGSSEKIYQMKKGSVGYADNDKLKEDVRKYEAEKAENYTSKIGDINATLEQAKKRYLIRAGILDENGNRIEPKMAPPVQNFPQESKKTEERISPASLQEIPLSQKNAPEGGIAPRENPQISPVDVPRPVTTNTANPVPEISFDSNAPIPPVTPTMGEQNIPKGQQNNPFAWILALVEVFKKLLEMMGNSISAPNPNTGKGTKNTQSSPKGPQRG